MNSRMLLGTGVLALWLAGSAQATFIDLTPGKGSSGTANGGIFEFFAYQPAGTGIFDPFVRIQRSGSEQGYNTSASDLPFDEKAGPWTHDIQLGDIPVINRNGVDYFEFVLDINEPGNGTGALLSLDAVQIYTSTQGSQNTTNVSMLGDLRYDLDAGEDSYVVMDYSNAPGSGSTDMRMLIPVTNFAGASPSDYVYLYSAFGGEYNSNDGFEEWGFVGQAVPGPAALFALGMGVLLSPRRRRDR